QGCREIRTFTQCWWDCKIVQLLWKIIWQFCKQLSISYHMPQHFYSQHMSKRSKDIWPHRNVYMNVHRGLIPNSQTVETLKCPSTEEWTNGQTWYMHTIEYYSAIKKNEGWIRATMWMNPENTMLSKNSQTQKATYYIILFL
ncbi:LORF2 protein, partial [Crocuta crocuta]